MKETTETKLDNAKNELQRIIKRIGAGISKAIKDFKNYSSPEEEMKRLDTKLALMTKKEAVAEKRDKINEKKAKLNKSKKDSNPFSGNDGWQSPF